ncbi:hypothetical protein SAMN04488563_3353 [Jiangella alkaliphila]|uniref:Uncharacterized protein n=2 Tax=Jiangella alkaliphila TaxID=419479 RepID=A0A1H2K2K7_9ACTN|nr:hypothetical protein SAMN04488563_3353 [Jiangella alkaliphila]
MKAAAVLQLARKAARANGLKIELLPKRGKGSHAIYLVMKDAEEVARFTLTNHTQDVSWKVLGQIEAGLAHLFGEKWMENR